MNYTAMCWANAVAAAIRTGLLGAAFLGAQCALAADSTPGAPVEVSVAPQTALVGQPVTIRGTTGYHKQANTVAIAVKPPSDPAPQPTTVQLNEKGEFTFKFTATQSAGKYSVAVTGPGGQGKGSANFVVTDLPGLADAFEAAFRAIEQRADQLTAKAKQDFASLPPSPQREELLKKIAVIEERARTVNLPPVEILGRLRQAVQGPNVANLPNQTILGKLQQSLDDMQQTVADIDRSGLIGARRDTICETINTAIEGAKFAGVAFNVAATALETLKAVFVDKAIGSLVETAMGETAGAAAVSAGIKTAAAGLDGAIGVLKSIPGCSSISWSTASSRCSTPIASASRDRCAYACS